jgi:hypothetical protein
MEIEAPETSFSGLMLFEKEQAGRTRWRVVIKRPGGRRECATITLLVIGIVGMAGYGWRRRKAAAV